MRKRGKGFKAQAYWANFSYYVELMFDSAAERARYKVIIPQETRPDIINYGNWQQIKESKRGQFYILDWSRYKNKDYKTPKRLYFSNFIKL